MAKSDLQTDYEQRKQKGETTSGKRSSASLIAIISLVISVAAFLLSAFVTILSSFRIKDDIRIVERGIPIVRHEPGSPNLSIDAPKQWVIMNAGNRAAAIAQAFVFFVTDNDQRDDCDKSIRDDANLLSLGHLNLDPFVIEPRRVEIRSIQLRHFEVNGKFTDSPSAEVPILNREKTLSGSIHGVKLCLAVQVVTPDQYSIVSRLVARTEWDWQSRQMIPDVGKLSTISRQSPWILVSESKWGFSDRKD
jgi:hypothetical protein